MPITAPPTITALPTPPDPNDRSTFNARAYPWSVAQQTFGTELGAVAENVYNNALEAKNQADAAAASAATATTQAGVAAGHANTASSAATTALNALDSFDDRYLGPKSSDPVTDNDGNALITGALYWNTSAGEMRVWNGAAWQVAAGSIEASFSIVREIHTATASQTVFTLTNTYTVGTNSLMVYRNGSRLLNTEYTETNANTVTLASPCTAGDKLLFEIGVVSAGTTTSAGLVTFNPTAGISATNVQAAIAELDARPIPTPAPVRTPANVSPANAATNVAATPTLTGSVFLSLYGLGQNGAQFQVSTSSDFGTVLHDSGTLGAVTAYTLPTGVLAVSTTYFWRVRYRDEENVWSEWSAPTSFTTASAFNSFIAAPTPTPANFGDPLEGGFYAGMIWNEVTTSATSRTLATGIQTFTVAVNMDATPLFYAGQQIEVRSRANPNNRFQGTVTGAIGTTLTVNVDTITGSGTFSDWSIMSRYRVIVAPKASGENAGIAWKNENTAGPVATQTLNEGWRATEAMRLAGTSTVYPAAHWCRNLNIGGRTDWYLPSRDELELCWRNLKPVTNNNYVTADRPNGATASYLRDGAFNDTANTHGTNNNSAPTGAAYTTTVPGQVAATAFRAGGAEAFEFGSAYYWSSTEYDASTAWSQLWFSSNPGYQGSYYKANTRSVRAVRRSII